MVQAIRRFGRDENGATAIEYALLAGMVAILCITALTSFGASFNNLFGYLSEHISPALNGN